MSNDRDSEENHSPSSSAAAVADWPSEGLITSNEIDEVLSHHTGLFNSIRLSRPDDDGSVTSLSYLQKHCAAGHVAHKQVAVRNVVKTLQSVEDDEAAVEAVFDIIQNWLARDPDPAIRSELLEQLPIMCLHCSQTPQLARYVREAQIPVLVQLLSDSNTQVRKTCQTAIMILIEQGLLTADDVVQFIFPELVQLSEQNGAADEVRVDSVMLLCKLVPTIGKENTINLFLARYTELCQDTIFHIRKTCASHLGEMSRVLGPDLTEKLLVSHLISLSQDSVWGVRKICAECFTDISYNCAMQTRRHQLAPVFIVLLADNSRWVQSSAFQALGPFISTFADPNRTGLLWVNGELVYVNPRDGEELSTKSIRGYDMNMGESNGDYCGSANGNRLEWSERADSSRKSEAAGASSQDGPASDTWQFQPGSSLHSDNSKSSEGASSHSGSRDTLNAGDAEFDKRYSTINFWKMDYAGGISDSSSSTDHSSSGQLYERFMERRFNVGGSSEFASETLSIHSSVPFAQNNELCDATADSDTLASIERQSRRTSDGAPVLETTMLQHIAPRYRSELDAAMKNFDYQDIIPQALLDQFLSMVEPSRAQSIESDISRHCAFNLPAVVFTIGRKYWPMIKPTYLALANDMQWKVRRTLAFSMHELAAILGPEIAVQDLLPVFSGFLRDLDEVRIGILRHLYDFLKLLDKDVRRSLLTNLADFLQTDNCRNWRFRRLFAEQLLLLCELYDIEDVNDYLSPIAMTLAIDKIADVRRITHQLLATILHYFYKEEAARGEVRDITDSFIQDMVRGFANSQRWSRRQTFVYICREVIRLSAVPVTKFADDLLRPLLNLARDPIPNVRIALATLLADYYSSGNDSYFNHFIFLEQLDNAVKSLAADSDRDVKLFASTCIHSDNTTVQNASDDQIR